VLAEALNYEIRKDWTPTADNFFARVTKATILASVAEARDEHTANLISHMKKLPMASEAQRLIDGTGWIPAPMRCEASVIVENDANDSEEETGLPDFLQADGEPETTAATA
jgi:ParB family chromosome partitioning protein